MSPPGRPRSAECDRAILDATLSCYGDSGFAGLTIDAVAEKAGVSKATIYRRYPTKADLVFEAVAEFSGRDESPPDTGSLRGDLVELTRRMARVLGNPEMQCVVRNMSADLARYHDFAEAHEVYVERKRAGTRAVLDAAVARGDIAGYDLDLVTDLMLGPLFFRVLFRRKKVDRAFLDTIADSVIAEL